MLTKAERARMRASCEAFPYPDAVEDDLLRCLDTLDDADALIARLVAVLRSVEWGDLTSDGWGRMIERCPICDHRRENGHKADCILAATLAAMPEEAMNNE